jgi:hypothetical protein
MRLTFGPSLLENFTADAIDRPLNGISTKWPLALASRQFWLWRAADGEGEVLDLCSNDAGTQIGSECAVTLTQIGRAQSGGPSSGLGSGGGFPCPERFVSYDAERVAGCEMMLDVGEDRGVNRLEALG